MNRIISFFINHLFILLLFTSFYTTAQNVKKKILPLYLLDSSSFVIINQNILKMHDSAYNEQIIKTLQGFGLNIKSVGLQSELFTSTEILLDSMTKKVGNPHYIIEINDFGLESKLNVFLFHEFTQPYEIAVPNMFYNSRNMYSLLEKFAKSINELKAEEPSSGNKRSKTYTPFFYTVYDEKPRQFEITNHLPLNLNEIKLNIPLFQTHQVHNTLEKDISKKIMKINSEYEKLNAQLQSLFLDYPFQKNHFQTPEIQESIFNGERYFYTTITEYNPEISEYKNIDFSTLEISNLGLPTEENTIPIIVQKYFVTPIVIDFYESKMYIGSKNFIDADNMLVHKYFLIDAKLIEKGKYKIE